MLVSDLPTHWRERAAELRMWAAAEGAASALDGAAVELEEALREAAEEELTLAEASRESGYSERRLREMLSEGRVSNAGEKGRPRIRRADLPRKPRRATKNTRGYDVASDAESLVGRMPDS